ncbi:MULTISPECIES: amino acid ABC transporter permease [Roseobacteraceae]|uniref:Putative glutamine ABC transporter permease protein GlnM n=1 Tax=Pseudosulfitobacter pseudonitzschiae TaxID=1402135 RepID=A0A221K800_9RHOB|nr:MULTISPECIES: amino acid ABC transporter permease [Roseobacteraceae]ASM75010.1 putative glutamine ABC transporter permease protein GlnM [Pseudosulfitobacter pseudonitzschiae]
MNYDWDFGIVFSHADVLFYGFIGTLKVGLVSLFFGAVFGLSLAFLRMSKFRLLSWPAVGVIEFFRITPPLALLFWAYYAMPIVLGISLNSYAAAVITLSMQSGAFMAEVYRAGIRSIEKSQWEGARALGMTQRQLMVRIILPQAIRRMVPPFTERGFELMKSTTIVSTIAYGELLYSSLVLSSQLYRPLEIITLVALVFFVLLTMASFLIRWLEYRLDAARL